MSIGTKSQFYQHSLKTAGLFGQAICSNRAHLYLRPPEDALSIESLYCRFRMTFDASVAVGNRVLSTVGIASRPSRSASYQRELVINQAADANRVVDITVDLSSLLRSTDVHFENDFGDFTTDDFTMVFVTLPNGLYQVLTVGIIDVWKLDGMFTTKEIR